VAAGAVKREIGRLVVRGALVRPATAAFFWRSLADVVRDGGGRDDVLQDARWPAHLHIDLLPVGRGRGVGRRLMEAWLARARAHGACGVHLGTFAENTAARRFFTACGFAPHGAPLVVPGFRTRAGARMHVQWMVRAV
jgi:GNAT superfamily N-acetyltransferase